MKNLKQLALLSFGIACTLASCSKGGSDAPTTPPTGTYASLSKAYEEVAPKSKIVDLNASTGGSFYGNSGTRYVFPANAFQTAAGAPVTGFVKIEVLECITESDMIFGKMLTHSNGLPLMSGGEVMVKASQEGAPLYIRPGVNYQVKLPTNKGAATAGMDYFSGNLSNTVPGTTVNWNLRNKDSLSLAFVYDGDTIIMMPDSVGFINCDKYANMYGLSTVSIKINGTGGAIEKEDVNAYYIIDGSLAASPIYSTTLAFTDNTFKNVKIIKANSHYVVCVLYKGDFYGGILKDITAIDGNTYTINVSKTTPKAFKAEIDLLK